MCRSLPRRRVPRAQHPAMSGLHSIYEQAHTRRKQRTDNTWGCLHPSKHTSRSGAEWNTADILVVSPRGDLVFRGVSRGREILIIKLSPAIPKRLGGLRQKRKAHSPRDNMTFLPLVRPYWGGGRQHQDGGVDRGYYGIPGTITSKLRTVAIIS